ncbi:MAG: hypothetical protein EOO78_34095 [Oxalobacteraceae bacterium]|nr:MAG: hypothetical protein EOO78_34095 [Oxalobacteraceae bacterium]
MGAGAAAAIQQNLPNATAAAPAEGKPDAYTPKFFTATEWKFVIAAVDRLIPHDQHGPGAVELGVPEFLDRHMQTLRYGARTTLQRAAHGQQRLAQALAPAVSASLARHAAVLDRAQLRLELLDPALVLQRGYAWIEDAQGGVVQSVRQVIAGQSLKATLADGSVALQVTGVNEKPAGAVSKAGPT